MRVAWALLAAVAFGGCGGGGGGVPIIQQSNVHFEGCPSAPQSVDGNCRAVATLNNTGAAGTDRQVFYYSLRAGDKVQHATCAPQVPMIPAGGTIQLTCDITVPANSVPTDLVLSGR